MKGTRLSPRLLSFFSVIFAAIIFAKQDIWISDLLQNIDPLLFTFWIFLVVTISGIIIAILKKESFKIVPAALLELAGLNVTTLVSWLFTFLALSKGSPAVVAAGTLSAPLLVSLILFERKRSLSFTNIALLVLIFLGLAIGAIEDSHSLELDTLTLIYCLLGSFGVVGNSFFMKRLHRFNIKGDVVLSYRFLLLLLFLSGYFYFQQGTVPTLPIALHTILSISLLTSYIPLFVLYYAHLHLEIFFINLLLALTPVFSLLLIAMTNNSQPIQPYHYLSIALVLIGVLVGYIKESRYEKTKTTYS